jgi:glycosyltransferase involved in cell wall biosynthesis
LSVINQSFQNFEIIVVNDNSIDKTYKILKKLQKEDERIKVINHSKNHGIYHSRVEGALNSKSNYILFLDPDDMILNQFLFEKVYDCFLNYNLDIIEYTVFYLKEEKNKIYYPKNQELNHYHNYSRKIIYQPELSNIIYYKPNSKKYSRIICRTVWNKIYKRSLVLKSIKYIGDSYYKNYYIIDAEDTLLNIIIFNFAENYTNLNNQ